MINFKKNGTDRIFVEKDEKTHHKIKEMQIFIEKARKSDKNYTFHSLRHSYAQKLYDYLINKGLSDYEARLLVSNRLGHNRIDVSQIYLDSVDA